MSDVVYCHLCFNAWFRDEWGLICPQCQNEAVEIITEDSDLAIAEGTFGTAEIHHILEDDVERQRARSWLYGGYINDEQECSRDEQAMVEENSSSDRSLAEPLEEVVIAVMGVTGSGKSTFIRTMTGNDGVHVGHGLESDTSEVNAYRVTHRNTELVLVDTPGFNDTNSSDEEIMTRVLEWLESSYRSGTRLNGLIYLHRIIDPKMQGSALKNVRMFRKLCGPECFGNIILATTFWDDITPELGDQREKQLKENDEFWGKMVKKGSEVVRLSTDRESGMKLLLKIAKKSKIILQSQQEMVEENKSAQETTAAQSIHVEIMRQRKEFEQKIEEQKLENERELERRHIARQEELERERINAVEQEKKRALLAALQKEGEEAAWQAEYARKQRELRNAEKEAEKEKRRLAAIEQRKQEELASGLREQQRLKMERQRYYDRYSCERTYPSTVVCDKCYRTVSNEYYYHCCFCRGDNYDQCTICGGCCPVTEHPVMKRKFKGPPPRQDSDCIVM